MNRSCSISAESISNLFALCSIIYPVMEGYFKKEEIVFLEVINYEENLNKNQTKIGQEISQRGNYEKD